MNIAETIIKDFVPTIIPLDTQKPGVTLLMMKTATVGSPDKKDLKGDYFKETTDWGDKMVKTVRVFLDHAHNNLTNEYMFPAKQLVGAAHVVPKDESFYEWLDEKGLDRSEALNRWYMVELDKSNDYHDYIMRLANEKRFGASTQAYMNGVVRQKDGGLDQWWENEVTFTVQPADKNTLGYIYELAKSFNLPVYLKDKDMSVNKKDAVTTDTEVVAEAVEAVATETTAEVAAETTDKPSETASLEAEIDKIISEEPEETVVVPVKVLEQILKGQQEIKDMYTSISAHYDTYASLDDLPELIRQLQALVGAADQAGSVKNMLNSLDTRMNDMNKGVTKFADHVIKKLKAEAIVESTLSDVEKTVRKDVREELNPALKTNAVSPSVKYFPPNAPGA